MRLWQYGVGFSVALGLGLGGGCAAGGNNGTTSSTAGTGGSGGGTGSGGGLITTSSGTSLSSSSGSGGSGGFGACAKFNAEAKQAPAAMLVVLDRSASMSVLNKWTTAQQALVQAIDNPLFDTMSLGLTAFPSGPTPAPACLLGIFPNVYCAHYPQGGIPIPMAAAGTDKSTAASGVRHDLSDWLFQHTPEINDLSDSSPIYEALSAGYDALKAFNIDKRIALLITDGGFSCTSVASPPRPGISDGLCPDWEYPSTVNTLISSARVNPSAPINTFVVGVPGSNSHGEMQGPYATAPYSMRLALSTYAVSGSPATVDPACDKGAVFAQGAPDPAKPCHLDLSNGASFNADALASAIAAVRGKALGCSYDLPPPPMGEMIDPGQVNVVVTIDSTDYTIPKRKDPADTCAAEPCWDYDAQGKVQLIGIACSTVSTSASAKVEIYVGCATILK